VANDRGVRRSVIVSHHLAVRDVDLQVASGEIVAVLGKNRSGKTTLFRLNEARCLPIAKNAKIQIACRCERADANDGLGAGTVGNYFSNRRVWNIKTAPLIENLKMQRSALRFKPFAIIGAVRTKSPVNFFRF